MRLKQIKLAGFKSFVDPTTVSFPGNRCAIVGPNGCGKSNIIDAVRWVMGESSARQLRGESLTDVIFNGSTSRKPTALASIELSFDNSDGRIGGEYAEYAEIAIRRQVTRDAQSAYFLNGTKCRRRDIMDIFLGTGFGPRSYSIIEQGMISQLVEAKPEDLRVYLEEAAGISKYKERRRETENRIRHTEENLERLNDMREELTRQLDHLQRQARAAERYRELKEEERKATAELHALRLVALEAALQRAKPRSVRSKSRSNARSPSSARSTPTSNAVARSTPSTATSSTKCRVATTSSAPTSPASKRRSRTTSSASPSSNSTSTRSSQRRKETDRQLAMDEEQILTLRSALAEAGPRVDAARARRRAIERRARSRRGALERMAGELGVVQRTRRREPARIRRRSIAHRAFRTGAAALARRARRSSTTKRATSLPATHRTTSASWRPASRRRPRR